MPANKSGRSYLFLILFVALAIRLDFLYASGFIIDSDEAIVGLMGKHILEGSALPVFYYGQHYMGSLEAILAAVSFAVLGVTPLALKLVPLLFSLALVVVVYKLALEFMGVRGANLAALLCALPPSPLVVWSAMARGGFIEIVLLCAISILLTVRWLKSQRPSLGYTALIGFILGVGWWVNNQILFALLPIGFFMVLRLRKIGAIFTHGVTGLTSWVFGSLPFWFYNISNDFASLGIFSRASSGDAVSHLAGVFETALPMLLGAKRFWHAEDVFPGATLMAYLTWGVIFATYLVLRAKPLSALIRGHVVNGASFEILSVFMITAVAAFSASSYGHLVTAPRYLLPLYIGFSVIGAFSIRELYSRNRIFGAAVLAAVLALNLSSSYLFGRAVPGQPFVFAQERASKDHAELIKWLDDRQITLIRTNYWIGYRLAFETEERIKFSIFGEPRQVRLPDYELEGRARGIENLPMVLVPSQAKLVRNALTVLGYKFSEIGLSGYEVFYGISRAQKDLKVLSPSEYTVSSNVNSAGIEAASDSDEKTRWGSAKPQAPGMEVVLTLDKSSSIRGIRYSLANWPHDYPRGLSISIEVGGQLRMIMNEDDYSAVRYFSDGAPEFTISFSPLDASKVVLSQSGSDPVFDWSIAEVGLLY